MKQKVDLAVINANIYNSYYKKFIKGTLTILNGKIYHIIKDSKETFEAEKIIDAKDKYIVPGFIDIHMHIESSMITPLAFSEVALKRGTTTIVSEPHEMANVNGIEGIKAMIKEGEKSPLEIFYGIPSSVPSTNLDLETPGAVIDEKEMEELYNIDSIKCVGEIMNYREIIKENNLPITHFIEKLRTHDKIFPIEGHCPSLVDEELSRFLFLGINADHTEHSMTELKQRFENGMFVEIQDKVLNKEVLDYIKENNLYEHFGYVTDDVMTDTLLEKGQLNYILQKAISLGETAENVIYNATFTNARRMNLLDRGVLSPGKKADFLILDNLKDLEVINTFINGKLIYSKGEDLDLGPSQFESKYYNSIKLDKISKEDIKIIPPIENGKVNVRVMCVEDGSTKTKELIKEVRVENSNLLFKEANLMLALVFNRYKKEVTHSIGFITGDCIKKGAVATTYSHDSHNLFTVGDNLEDILICCNRVIEMQGGIVTAENKKITAEMQLNINGILSDKKAVEAAKDLREIREALINQGYKHYNPIMSLCTLGLPASPALKLTDKGLVDVPNSKIVSLFL